MSLVRPGSRRPRGRNRARWLAGAFLALVVAVTGAPGLAGAEAPSAAHSPAGSPAGPSASSAPATSFGATRGAPGPTAPGRASLPDIERDVMCPVCGVPLNLADSPQADRERAFIRTLIARGQDAAQIKRALVAQFGTGVLALPPSHGFDLTAYLVPIGVGALVLVLAALLLPRWRRRAPAGASVAPALPDAEARRLERDLARYDL